MIVFRKGKKQIAIYKSAFEFAEDAATLQATFGTNAANVANFARRNAFGLAITGARMGFGNGYILEAKRG